MKYKLFLVSFFLPFAAGFIGSYFTIDAIATWYASLNKPFFNPPNWVFAPVWTLLYFLMGLSFYLVLTTKAKKKIKKLAVKIFLAQLILNSLWSIVFFGMKNIPLAFVEILVLLAFVFYTIKIFAKINKKAAFLLVPYFLWGSFATILNLSILILN